MSKSPATREFARRERPLSPHLTVYRPPITMTMSIIHRITGGALYFGTLLVALWLMAAASSQSTFDAVNWAFGSWLGRLVLFFYTWALMHHMLGGVRHLIWDTGAGLEKDTASRIAWATLAGSIVLTLLIWVAGYMARGA
ncbi:MAG: succinate dehydrogenase, cytochrome b556 subunit [Mesorhizobium sp.]|jgi:succinate dehydrogenase / fumarate reductase, cytochrome b subunit|uniref:succinate dehydrogenase, cytochrome b556 subunit n=1 Tax=unclassified Mesorhizobium TaxID=325217 RepID=UPI000FC9FDD6|nr:MULTISPECIES: succinate dehydrogenase, cytochrome b556 subunit [unclassified Mesorhizobium]RUV66663.1 succinate dehydrogenase, cytochrome b556 subunit [Mesorhizobium sp. M5C.F.Cr.IN.023.01.1.1]RWB25688.1 MAG: succinate dehydrogenase, cytochrome b556 subunit [Mesorhizobium sp.]RWC19636.1 MAG: succinate dehydrogenase, cytochrome b556 subunit [Mesorhizobium sp.]RWD31510.1 MAG: succinate dehydrogenase, cytochrome b556 subunit [Mesorhizobium sp.]RWD46603.1 MAG: succinate dehydrogenase, cytochrom